MVFQCSKRSWHDDDDDDDDEDGRKRGQGVQESEQKGAPPTHRAPAQRAA